MKTAKIFGKTVPVWAIAVALIVIIATVSAGALILSNIVTVHVIPIPPVEYALTLEPEDQTIYVGETATFTATLIAEDYKGNVLPVEGAEINLYFVEYPGIVLDTGLTDASGQCMLESVSIGDVIDVSFEAGYLTP